MKKTLIAGLLIAVAVPLTSSTKEFKAPIVTPQKTEIVFKKEVVKKKEPHIEVYEALLSEGIDSLSAKVLVAQASFESGGFKNPLTEKSKNCFAIHYNKYRETLSYGSGGEAERHRMFAQYYSLDSAARDFVKFLDYRNISKKIKSIDNYAYTLKKKHYYGSDYKLYAYGIRVHYHKLWLNKK